MGEKKSWFGLAGSAMAALLSAMFLRLILPVNVFFLIVFWLFIFYANLLLARWEENAPLRHLSGRILDLGFVAMAFLGLRIAVGYFFDLPNSPPWLQAVLGAFASRQLTPRVKTRG